ncbi:MAG: hypothetical protein U0736_04920 [Gemmataceae bacterium]
MRRLMLALMMAGWATAAPAADLAQINRTIGKEPAYRGKPRYCLLVLGAKADTRVWLVLDGQTLYVDRNGNGDLTDPGERLAVKTPNQDPAAFEETEITAGAGGPVKFRFHLYGWFALRDGKEDPKRELEASIGVTLPDGRRFGAWGDERAGLIFAPRPQDAPVVHLGGPLVMGFEVRHPLEKKSNGRFELSVGVGTRGLGAGSFAHLCYNVVPKDVYPKAVLEFPNKERGGPPVRVEMTLKERC